MPRINAQVRFSAGVSKHVGRVGNGDAAASGLREINVVVADGDTGNNLEFLVLRQEFDIDPFTTPR